jgi:hypothetical protein
VKSFFRWGGLALLATAAWLALASWIPSPSERIYLLAPPCLAVAAIIGGQVSLSSLRKRTIELLVLALAVLFVSATYGMQAPGTIGISWANLKRAALSGEVFIAAYFLFSLVTIILGTRALLVYGSRRLLLRENSGFGRGGELTDLRFRVSSFSRLSLSNHSFPGSAWECRLPTGSAGMDR